MENTKENVFIQPQTGGMHNLTTFDFSAIYNSFFPTETQDCKSAKSNDLQSWKSLISSSSFHSVQSRNTSSTSVRSASMTSLSGVGSKRRSKSKFGSLPDIETYAKLLKCEGGDVFKPEVKAPAENLEESNSKSEDKEESNFGSIYKFDCDSFTFNPDKSRGSKSLDLKYAQETSESVSTLNNQLEFSKSLNDKNSECFDVKNLSKLNLSLEKLENNVFKMFASELSGASKNEDIQPLQDPQEQLNESTSENSVGKSELQSQTDFTDNFATAKDSLENVIKYEETVKTEKSDNSFVTKYVDNLSSALNDELDSINERKIQSSCFYQHFLRLNEAENTSKLTKVYETKSLQTDETRYKSASASVDMTSKLFQEMQENNIKNRKAIAYLNKVRKEDVVTISTLTSVNNSLRSELEVNQFKSDQVIKAFRAAFEIAIRESPKLQNRLNKIYKNLKPHLVDSTSSLSSESLSHFSIESAENKLVFPSLKKENAGFSFEAVLEYIQKIFSENFTSFDCVVETMSSFLASDISLSLSPSLSGSEIEQKLLTSASSFNQSKKIIEEKMSLNFLNSHSKKFVISSFFCFLFSCYLKKCHVSSAVNNIAEIRFISLSK